MKEVTAADIERLTKDLQAHEPGAEFCGAVLLFKMKVESGGTGLVALPFGQVAPHLDDVVERTTYALQDGDPGYHGPWTSATFGHCMCGGASCYINNNKDKEVESHGN